MDVELVLLPKLVPDDGVVFELENKVNGLEVFSEARLVACLKK